MDTTLIRLGRWLSSAKVRTSLLFFSGLGLTIREALMNGPDRPSFYVLYAGMMGFPIITQAQSSPGGDHKRSKPEDDE